MPGEKYTIGELIQTDNDEFILAKILKQSREFVLSHPERVLTSGQYSDFKKLKARILNGLPLAYALGYKWFFGNRFKVSPNVLIPRPETELLVEEALHLVKQNKSKLKAVVDVGTGSGAIIISVAKAIQHRFSLYASDISAKAITLAKANAKELKAGKIIFLHGNLFEPFLKKEKTRKNLLILANLPYLSKFELKEPSIKYEPRNALLGGRVGYELIKKLIEQIAEAKISDSAILFEIGFSQARDLTLFIKKSLPSARIKVHKDLAGLDRVLEIKI